MRLPFAFWAVSDQLRLVNVYNRGARRPAAYPWPGGTTLPFRELTVCTDRLLRRSRTPADPPKRLAT